MRTAHPNKLLLCLFRVTQTQVPEPTAELLTTTHVPIPRIVTLNPTSLMDDIPHRLSEPDNLLICPVDSHPMSVVEVRTGCHVCF